MKNTLMFLFAVIFTLNVHAAHQESKRVNGLLRFVAHNAALRNYALYTLIANRCNRYMNYFDQISCQEAVKHKIRILDYDIILSNNKNLLPIEPKTWNPKSFVFVAFKNDFLELLGQKKTTEYLYDLQQQLSKFMTREISDLNIWSLTMGHYKSKFKSAQVMAVLFQDTSIMKLHLAYLDRAEIKGNTAFNTNKVLLSRVINTINLVLDLSEAHYQDLFYPRELQSHLNRNIYHFYVPLYLAMALEQKGFSPRFAYSAPLMMTLTYEFITSANDGRYFMKDPMYLDEEKEQSKLRDIFGGYCGANFGVFDMNFDRDFSYMKESFSRSTEEAVRFMLRL